MIKHIEISVGITEAAPGFKVNLSPLKPISLVIPGSTATHEAAHAVAAILEKVDVKDASRIVGPGYLGRTRIGHFNAIAFMAAHAWGCDGTGYDRAVVALMGHDVGSATLAARSVLSGHEDEIYAVASLVETKGTVSGREIEAVMEEVRNPRFRIDLTTPDGQEKHYVGRVKRRKPVISLITKDHTDDAQVRAVLIFP